MQQTRLAFFRSGVVPLGSGFAILLALLGVVVWFMAIQRQSGDAKARSLDTIIHLTGLLSALQDAETGQRGYLLSNDKAYLEPYDAALPEIDAKIEALGDRAGADGHPLAERLKGPVRDKLSELESTIRLHQLGRTGEALAIVTSNSGRATMDSLRVAIDGMTAVGQAEAERAHAQREWAISRLWFLMIGSATLILALMIFALQNSYAQMKNLVASRDSLAASNRLLLEEAARRESAEAQLRQAQKMEVIGQIAGGLAHDFNNMLAVIIGSLNLLKRKIARNDGDFEQYIDSAMTGAERAATLTHRLLAFSRQQPLTPQSIDVNKFVGGMSELLRRALGESVELETVLAGGLWRTFADAGQLENALLNLAVNARDAMSDGGKLTIETANCHLDDRYSAEHTDVPAGQYVLVAVSDTGSGMTADTITRAFEPFFTTKAAGKGTGLGLSQVHGFIKQSGGHIKIYSELGHGTTVKLYLPRFFGKDEVQWESPPRSSIDATGRPDEVILVVEDEERARQITCESLRELGYTVLAASSGSAALDVLESRDDVLLLFTDIVMPGMNGRQLADEAQRRRPNLKVLYTTGYTRNAIIHNGIVDPGVQLISKPFSLQQLAARVRSILTASRDERTES